MLVEGAFSGPQSRRSLLRAALGTAVAAALPARGAFAQATSAIELVPRKIDVHHHILPPIYVETARRHGLINDLYSDPASSPAHWTPESSLREMDRYGIRTAMTSITAPGVWWDDAAAARTLARQCNEYGAQLAHDHPGRFGMFASLPLPDADASRAEIAHAFDVLHADGVVLMSSYGNRWLGDPAFSSTFDLLDRRRAVVFVHPTFPACCRSLVPGVDPEVEEFFVDTTRTVTSLLYSGTFRRCPNIRFIFTHAGGVTTTLAERIAGGFKSVAAKNPALSDPDPLATLKSLYFDFAVSTSHAGFAALRAFLATDHILFGTDYPYAQIESTLGPLAREHFAEGEAVAIMRQNAAGLFPRYAA